MQITDKNMYVCPNHPNTFLVPIYGCGWDYDRFVCIERDCSFEYELETATYYEEEVKNGTL